LPKFSFYYSIKFWFVSFGFIFVYRLTSIEPRDYRVVFVIQKEPVTFFVTGSFFVIKPSPPQYTCNDMYEN